MFKIKCDKCGSFWTYATTKGKVRCRRCANINKLTVQEYFESIKGSKKEELNNG